MSGWQSTSHCSSPCSGVPTRTVSFPKSRNGNRARITASRRFWMKLMSASSDCNYISGKTCATSLPLSTNFSNGSDFGNPRPPSQSTHCAVASQSGFHNSLPSLTEAKSKQRCCQAAPNIFAPAVSPNKFMISCAHSAHKKLLVPHDLGCVPAPTVWMSEWKKAIWLRFARLCRKIVSTSSQCEAIQREIPVFGVENPGQSINTTLHNHQPQGALGKVFPSVTRRFYWLNQGL